MSIELWKLRYKKWDMSDVRTKQALNDKFTISYQLKFLG